MKVNKVTPGHNLKWESSRMMLPEHVEAIRQHQKKRQKKNKPSVDEQQMEQFSQMISEAATLGTELTISIFGPYGNQTVQGKIEKIDHALRRLKMVKQNEQRWISLDDIVDIES